MLLPAGMVTWAPLTKAPPTSPTGPKRTMPPMEAPAAPATVLACCFASSPTVTGIFSPFTAVTEEKSMSMRASRPKMRGCTTFLIVALPRAPFGRTRASPTYTLSSAIKSTLSPAWAVLLLMSSMNLILIRESFGSVTV